MEKKIKINKNDLFPIECANCHLKILVDIPENVTCTRCGHQDCYIDKCCLCGRGISFGITCYECGLKVKSKIPPELLMDYINSIARIGGSIIYFAKNPNVQRDKKFFKDNLDTYQKGIDSIRQNFKYSVKTGKIGAVGWTEKDFKE